jgi:hypothetical protein
LIEKLELGARKIGIANQSSDRLEKWRKRGWKVVWKHESKDGKAVLDLETKVLRWIRKDLGLPPHLGDQELGSIGGWSETFSSDGVTNQVLISKIETLLEETATNSEKS